MTLLFHILFSGIWIGTAATLPFWNYSVNKADNLDSVLNMSDTIFRLKCILIMGSLTISLSSGAYLTYLNGFDFLSRDESLSWLTHSQILASVILVISLVILFFMIQGRKGLRTYFRYIPPLGYSNIAFIILIYVQMVLKPDNGLQLTYLYIPLLLVAMFNILFFTLLNRKLNKLKNMPGKQFAKLYFGLLEKEDMTMFFRLFTDDAIIVDPFATGPVKGKISIERFFQELGDQFEDISIKPVDTTSDKDTITTRWLATGITKNGQHMKDLTGTNKMELLHGKINKMIIDFDINDLPQVTRVVPQ